MMRNVWKAAGAAVALLAVLSGAASAGSLDDIVKRGRIRVGVYVDNPPIGYTDDAGNPTGADIDVARLLAKDLKVELDLVPVTAPNRVPFLLTNKVDVVMASLVPSPERAKTISFSNPYGSLPIAVFARKDTVIREPADLAGKRLSVVRGSVAAQAIKAVAPKCATIVEYDDNATTITAFASGQTDAVVIASSTGQILAKQANGTPVEAKLTVKNVYYSIGLRRGDPDLLHWLNIFIFTHSEDGELNAIYKNRFGQEMKTFPVF
ncbi:transporter substrate-binding domain-containing protein [Methylobacterium currus]|uniref:transporter substrate-binding domain-containing protein n=1 Tax=Methylobacterium currus TaxID=2051553 RepID=UPI001E5BB6AF|nr:transporter substrate-binding domain-containing protein [Methylobacterium currus]UHC19511.1 transporter substrate-binding domain-containing protein [Methylobacterium currus]